MWFCFNDAFVSVVEMKNKPGLLMVRARAHEHLTNLFGTEEYGAVHTTPEHDYRYRVYCTKEEWAAIVSKRIAEINYTNFKDSVKDDKLHTLYEDFWFLHMIYQNGKKWWKRQQKAWAKQIAHKDSAVETK
jgi:hypothetical protein